METPNLDFLADLASNKGACYAEIVPSRTGGDGRQAIRFGGTYPHRRLSFVMRYMEQAPIEPFRRFIKCMWVLNRDYRQEDGGEMLWPESDGGFAGRHVRAGLL